MLLINPKNLKDIPSLEDKTCFACGENNPIGLHMHFKTDEQHIISNLKVPSVMSGWDQIVHGGIISTMLDEIMAWTVIYIHKKIGVTKSIAIDFIKPVKAEKELTIIGSLQEIQSERQVLVKGEIYSNEILCAKASGQFTVLSPQMAIRLKVMSEEYLQQFLPILNRT